jgi:hypothetical protein
MAKTGSELTREMVGPAGSTSEGAFSCTGWEDELCRSDDGLLLEDCAKATGAIRSAAAEMRMARLRKGLNDMKKNLA